VLQKEELKPHDKFQTHTISPSGRKVTGLFLKKIKKLPYGWYSPGGDSHTKNVHIFLNTDDFMTFL
jgi:hypothetical protein